MESEKEEVANILNILNSQICRVTLNIKFMYLSGLMFQSLNKPFFGVEAKKGGKCSCCARSHGTNPVYTYINSYIRG